MVTMEGPVEIRPAGKDIVLADLEVGRGLSGTRGDVKVALSNRGWYDEIADVESVELPWKVPSKAHDYTGDPGQDLKLLVTITTKSQGTFHGQEHFLIPSDTSQYKLDKQLHPEGDLIAYQPKIGGKPGTMNRPLVEFRVNGGNLVVTFKDLRLLGPAHRHIPQKMWLWLRETSIPPDFDLRPNQSDAFWTHDDLESEGLPTPYYPNAAHAINYSKAICTEGNTYWLFAIIEEEYNGITEYRAHRGLSPITARVGTSFLHGFEQDQQTNTNPPPP